MIIKRGFLFITIALLLLLPWQVCGASSKNHAKKISSGSSKNVSQKKSGKIKSPTKSKKSLKTRKKAVKQLAHDNPANDAAKDAPPLIKITPLENGKYLLEPMDSSTNTMDNKADSLSLIKKPVFEEGELESGDFRQKIMNPLASFPNLLVQISEQLLGKSYRMGGNGKGSDGIDCSGFVKKIYQSLTLSLPHSSREQAKMGSLVTTEWDLSRLKIGDLLFFKRNRGAQIGHTGMYIGDGKMIHSASKKGVVVSNLMASNYYNRNFVMAKRLFIIDNGQKNEFKEFKEP